MGIRHDLETITNEPWNSPYTNAAKKKQIEDRTNLIRELVQSCVIDFPYQDNDFDFQFTINCYAYALGLWRFEKFRRRGYFHNTDALVTPSVPAEVRQKHDNQSYNS